MTGVYDSHEAWLKSAAMTRDDVLAECREAKGRKEISDACARAIIRLLRGGWEQLFATHFMLYGELPADDDGYPHATGSLDGGTRLWRTLFGEHYSHMSPDDKLMGDMLGTYLLNCAKERHDVIDQQ